MYFEWVSLNLRILTIQALLGNEDTGKGMFHQHGTSTEMVFPCRTLDNTVIQIVEEDVGEMTGLEHLTWSAPDTEYTGRVDFV